MTEAAVKWGGPGEDYRLSRINRTGSRAEIHVDAPSPDNAAPIWQTVSYTHLTLPTTPYV